MLNSKAGCARQWLTTPHSTLRTPHFWLSCSTLAIVLLLAGCAGYRMGAGSLYAPDIRTVYVPIFESASFRRHLGERLTEAVVKEIELKTPYKVVGSPNADSVLTGQITSETKRVVVENPLDDPRQSEVKLVVSVTWVDRRGDLIRQGSVLLPPSVAEISQASKLTNEVGHSVATAHQLAINRMAEQIVGLMETPW